MRKLVKSLYRCPCGRVYNHIEVLHLTIDYGYHPDTRLVNKSVKGDLVYRCKWCKSDYKNEGLIRSKVL